MRRGRTALLVCAALALGAAFSAIAAPAPSPLQKENAALKRANAQLKAKVNELANENAQLYVQAQDLPLVQQQLKTAQADLASAQSSVPAAIATMGAVSVWNTVLPAVTGVLAQAAPKFKVSTFNQGDYQEIDYDWCGFC